jgi:predicted enzyme related to lactoylglutathione lyase
VAGCLYQNDEALPSASGPLLYFDVNGRLDEAIAQVEANQGKVLEPKHSIAPHGFRALVLDSEGNRIALHSMTD